MSAISQPGEGSLTGHCPLAADRRLFLWTEMLSAGWSLCGLKTTTSMETICVSP